MTRREDGIPEAIRVVRDFVNTAEPQVGEEQLTDPGRLRDWLRAHELAVPDAPLTPADLRRGVEIREGLRVVLQAHAGHPVDHAALEPLNAALAGSPLHLRFDGVAARRLVPVEGDGLGGLLALIGTATEAAGWTRLKVCARQSCRWAYYDSSRNRAGRWCSMAGCGNQAKMRRAYAARKRRAGPVAGS